MGEGLLSFRKKGQSSIRVGTELVRNGEAGAFVSMGNTAAVVYISRKTIGALKGVDKPALALLLPNMRGATLLIDAGANANCKPHHLVQFAVMGKIFMETAPRPGQPARRPDEHRRGEVQGERPDQGDVRPPPGLAAQLRRQHGRQGHLLRQGRRHRQRRLHRERRPEGLGRGRREPVLDGPQRGHEEPVRQGRPPPDETEPQEGL